MPLISLESEGSLAVINLENPPQNRINEALAAELSSALDSIEAGEFRAVLLRANGPDFSFGGDIMN
jgi:enoyl-CoA hydratase/carnithine racemase